jgi:protein-S-isoprenylcysteine O-methyltransferase Ste14
MMAGIPIALGPGWGLLVLAAMMPALVWRILDEERFLAAGLPGYEAYRQKVRYRLIPGVGCGEFLSFLNGAGSRACECAAARRRV